VLEALLDVGEAPAEDLARRTGVHGDDVTAALDRLVALRYADRRGPAREGAAEVYRPVARSAR